MSTVSHPPAVHRRTEPASLFAASYSRVQGGCTFISVRIIPRTKPDTTFQMEKGAIASPLPYSHASVGSSKPPLHTPGSHPAAATQDPQHSSQDLCSTPLSQPQKGSTSRFLPSLHLLRLMSSHSYNLPQLLGMAALPQLIFFSVSSTRTSLRTHLQSHF